jgi:N-acetylneuraminic acid mutarotase
MKKRLLFIAMLLMYALFFIGTEFSVLQGQPIKGSWTSIADLPTARWFPGTSAYDGKIYVIGGNTNSTSAPLDIVEVYDPSNDTWEPKSPMPESRAQLSSAVVDGKIYVIGGSSGPTSWAPVANVYIYDPSSDTWSQGTDMPGPRTELALVAAAGKIYAIGGITGSSAGSNSVDIYDPSSDTWSQGADMPTARGTMPAVELNGKIYVFGGSNGNASGWNHYPTLEVYDIAGNTWETKANMPFSRSHLAGCVLNNKIYALGGSQVNSGVTYADVASYDAATNTWTTEPSMLTAREAFKAVTLDGKIFAIGGTQMQNSLVAFSNSEVFDTVPKVFISDSELRLPMQQSGFIGKIFVPNSGSLDFTYQLIEDVYDDSLFLLHNDSILAANDFELTAAKEFTIEVLAISENDDSVRTLINLDAIFRVEALFTGPMGFLLTSSDKKVMIDNLSSKSPCYSFISNSDTIYESMKSGADPFNHVDIIYTSHSHCCHFDPVLLFNAITNNPEAIAIMNDDVRTAMNTYFTDNPDLLDRVYVPDLSLNEYIDTTIAGVELRLTKISHEGLSTLCINIMLDSIRFTDFDDYNDLTTGTYQTIGFTQVPTDVAFLGSQLLNRQDILTAIYNPSGLLTFSHINGYTQSLYNTLMTSAADLNELGYQTKILGWPMQLFAYKKLRNKMFSSTLNSPPVLSRSFSEVNAETNTTVIVTIPASSFVDPEPDDNISYSFLINGHPLSYYDWSTFENAQSRLVMTPTVAGNYTITVIATDNHLSFAKTAFAMHITDPEAIENAENNESFNIYPNPAQSNITIESASILNNTYSVRLINMLGETVYTKNELNERIFSIDISRFPESMMYLVMTLEGRSECYKVIKN